MRIRALKPGFFKNDELCALSAWHRLAFAGLWGCADRDGRIEDRPKRLKAEIFPYDDLELNDILWDLAAAGFIVRYQVNLRPLIWIPTWDEHQHPRQDEAMSVLPAYTPGSERASGPIQTTSVVSLSTVTDPSLPSDDGETTKRMGNGDWEMGDGTVGVPRAVCRAADLVELWNSTTKPPLPRCRELTDERRRKVRQRLRKRPSLTDWRAIFERIDNSQFCRGEAGSRDGHQPWVADFDWIIANDTNSAKVLEGKYDNRGSPKPTLVGGARQWSWSDCHHEPHCGSAGKCLQRQETDAWKAQQAAS